MAPAYKVTYFELTGLGEPLRFLLSYGGFEFDDIRIPKEKWPAVKSSLPYGQLPILEYNGKIANQSLAICRYLAKQVKLVGKDDWEDLEIDATVDTINDLRLKIAFYFFETNEKIKLELAGPLYNETIPFYLEKLDAQVKKNNGYFVNGRLTWADIFFVALDDYMSLLTKKDLTVNYPNLQIVKERVLKVPRIKAWVDKRPRSKFFD
ncbi:glutathione S-transferase [Anoplophora glabripennis]|uniref:glutathione S-transferase n=1 Tax=Anoplophora glabripennis TaxID=217634 RepID=UPI000873B78F|nr:glutathione S-transferase [Anoplophora glabripennis]XP_018560986.1 glutathione S-transferase [Anoplophora glabripennis]